MKAFTLIDHNGNDGVTIEGHNFTGGECVKAIAAIEKALGEPSGQRKLKPEFYKQVKTTNQAQTKLQS
jgi:Protein of unknown function (DUF2997)